MAKSKIAEADPNKLRHNQTYPRVDPLRKDEKELFGPHPRVVWTGDHRPPLKGEWYLSGSVIEAYRAPNDLSTPYPIARLTRH